jgi:uncharacterized protein (TIGR03435 family)
MIRTWTAMLLSTATLAAGVVVTRAAQAPPRFEVASIKPSARPPTGPVGVRIGPTQARFTFGSLRAYIAAAYGVRDHQIAGPAWMGTAMFDIIAKMPEDAAALKQVPPMLRALLEERFRIRTHREPRELPVYALEVAPHGPPLVRLPDEAPPPGPFMAESGPGAGGRVTDLGDGGTFAVGGNRFEATRVTMKALADLLAPFVDRPILDMTGLEGRYNVAVVLTPEDFQALMSRSVAAAGYVVSPEALRLAETASSVAVPDALARVGLKLRQQRAPIEVLVIDSIDRTPTEN